MLFETESNVPSGAPGRRGDSLECRERSNQQDLRHRGAPGSRCSLSAGIRKETL